MRLTEFAPLLAVLPSAFAAVPQRPAFANTTVLPRHYAMLVFPGFQALDLFGPLDVFNSIGLIFNQTDMQLSIISKTMDPVTTIPQKSARMNMTHGNFGESIMPTTTFKEVLAQKANGGNTTHGMDNCDIEVLLVPGGSSTREPMTEEIEFVKEMYPNLKWILSVCTGATVLARAGILDGHKATTNKRSWAWATSTGPKVNWVPTARWVEDGNIWTSSGVTAGIDLAFAWMGHVYGQEAAEYLADNMEYVMWKGGSSNDPFSKIWEVPGAAQMSVTKAEEEEDCLTLG